MNLKSKAISEIRATIKTLAAKLENVEDAQISERIEALNYLLGDLLTEQGGKGVPTEQEIKNASKAHYMQYDGEYDSIAVADKAYQEAAQWAISQMQPEITTLKRHDKQLRAWINSMAYEIKVLKTALKDTQEFSSDDQLSEWLFDQDYHTQVIIQEKTECTKEPQPPTK